jgi:cyclopropane fatty-acyl-phospholipid synthase-like methyltransferase
MTEIVREGYDAIARTFEAWRDRIVGDPRDEWRELLESKLADGARVLELGCGSGHDARKLARRFRVTGVDFSRTQLDLATGVETIQADFLELELPAASYDACVSFYVFNHVPRQELAPLLAKIHRWLVPGGWFLHAFGQSDTEAWTGEWLGAPNFFSSFPAEVNSRLVREAGFEIERDELVTFREPEGEATFQWVLARSI